MSEKNLDEFFRDSETTFKTRQEKRVQTTKEKTTKTRGKISKFFVDRFSFDANVELTDKCSVLYRRNYVIKNIIFIVNLVFTLFSFIGLKGTGSSSNLIITIVFWLLMTGLSTTITILLKNKKEDYTRQKIVMYFQSLYVFFLSCLLYIKIWLSFSLRLPQGEELPAAEFSITQAAYLLIYFSIFVMALYQNKKLLVRLFPWNFIVLTIIHITFLHPDLFSNANSFKAFIEYMFVEKREIALDVLLRTLVLFLFFAGIYSSVSIAEYISKERRTEFTKRVDVETNFVDVVKSVFEAVKVYNLNANALQQTILSQKISNIAAVLSIASGFSQSTIDEIYNFSKVHVDNMKNLSLDQDIEEEDFDTIMKKIDLARTIIKRLQLSKKSEDIVNAILQNEVDGEFRHKMNSIFKDKKSEIVVLSEVYVLLRCDRKYNRALNHARTMEFIINDISSFFSDDLIQRFAKYSVEIENAYKK